MTITRIIMNDNPSPLPRRQQGQFHIVFSRRSLLSCRRTIRVFLLPLKGAYDET
jgi:hypothetical protein